MNFFMSGELSGDSSADMIDLIIGIEKQVKTLEKNNYGDINDIAVIPVIVELSGELEAQGFFKERKLVKRKTGEADYRLRINYYKFIEADDTTRKLLIIKNIIDSIRDIGRKVKGFEAQRFEDDILDLFGIENNNLNDL